MDAFTRSGLLVPDEYGASTQGRSPVPVGMPPDEPGLTGTVVNETDLPDEMVTGAIKDYFVEHASMAWGHTTNFQSYTNQQGSLLARSDYRTPTNVIEEIKLARDLAEKDDDVRAVMGNLIALAFGAGMENQHEDEKTLALFNAIARKANLDAKFKEMYREYLIASQFTTATMFTREKLDYRVAGTDSQQTEDVRVPLIGVLPSENIRVVGNDIFGTAILAYDPDNERLREWLREYFDPRTTAARKAELGRQDRVSANLFTGKVEVDPMAPPEDRPNDFASNDLYLLNPRLCQRTSMPKGSWKYPRPLMTASFALLEAKRLLNIMDYALLQGGSNFVVVAKKGTDDRPAQPAEIANLQQVVRAASRTGVIVGDHRLSFEIITPKLDELLSASKRNLIGRKIAMAMMRTPEQGEESGGEGQRVDVEIMSRVIEGDRRDIKRHVEGDAIYGEVAKRNPSVFTKGTASVWFPKIILQGAQFFLDVILKLRDRGDIPRKYAVEAAGFDYDASVQQRKRELERGDDEVLIPGMVPHSSAESGPQDNGDGRPKGSQDGRSTNDPARPKRKITQNQGETVVAWYEEEVGQVVRMGEVTRAIMEEYRDTHSIGRVNNIERDAVYSETAYRQGPVAVIPVNHGVEFVEELKAVRLEEGLSMIVGKRKRDGAFMARALCFREPHFDTSDAEERAAAWGFPLTVVEESGLPVPEETAAATPPLELHVHIPGQRSTRRRLLRDNAGNITGSEEVAEEDSIFDPADDAVQEVLDAFRSQFQFDFDRLRPHMPKSVTSVKVSFAKLPDRVSGVTSADGAIQLDEALRGKTDELVRVLGHETGHLIDFWVFTPKERKAVYIAMHGGHVPEGHEREHKWFDSKNYWDDVGEAFASGWVRAYSTLEPYSEKLYSHHIDATGVKTIKAIIEKAVKG